MNKCFIIGLNQVSWGQGRTVGIWEGNGEVEKWKSGKAEKLIFLPKKSLKGKKHSIWERPN